jgi:hypothetical protein
MCQRAASGASPAGRLERALLGDDAAWQQGQSSTEIADKVKMLRRFIAVLPFAMALRPRRQLRRPG